MWIIDKLKAIPGMQKYRYGWIIFSCVAFLSPLAFIPSLADNPDLCGKLCMRRFYLYFPGMTFDDFIQHASVAFIGVIALIIILVTTFFFGRFWCSFLCPVGGFPEMVSRMINDRWKIEFRGLPQVPIRYGYFAAYLVLLPILGVSACSLCIPFQETVHRCCRHQQKHKFTSFCSESWVSWIIHQKTKANNK